MPELFSDDNAFTQRDIDQLVADVAAMPVSQLATVVSYDELSQTGSARSATGAILQFKNWSGSSLVDNTRVLVLTKDLVNYVIATEETVSGWASVQKVIKITAPVYNTGANPQLVLRKEYVGCLLIVGNTSGTVEVGVGHDIALSPGQSIDFIRGGSAEVAFTRLVNPNNQVSLYAYPGLRLQSTWSAATLICTDPNTYVVIGDLKP
jgi:hypothetical protein